MEQGSGIVENLLFTERTLVLLVLFPHMLVLLFQSRKRLQHLINQNFQLKHKSTKSCYCKDIMQDVFLNLQQSSLAKNRQAKECFKGEETIFFWNSGKLANLKSFATLFQAF